MLESTELRIHYRQEAEPPQRKDHSELHPLTNGTEDNYFNF